MEPQESQNDPQGLPKSGFEVKKWSQKGHSGALPPAPVPEQKHTISVLKKGAVSGLHMLFLWVFLTKTSHLGEHFVGAFLKSIHSTFCGDVYKQTHSSLGQRTEREECSEL